MLVLSCLLSRDSRAVSKRLIQFRASQALSFSRKATLFPNGTNPSDLLRAEHGGGWDDSGRQNAPQIAYVYAMEPLMAPLRGVAPVLMPRLHISAKAADNGDNSKRVDLAEKDKREKKANKLPVVETAAESPEKSSDSEAAERTRSDAAETGELATEDEVEPETEIERSPHDSTVTNGGAGAAAGRSTPAAPGGSNDGNSNDGDSGDERDTQPASASPKAYPPLLAIAMKDRPQLPGRLVCIHISSPSVIKSMNEIVRRKEPHFVLFHMKNPDDPDTDIIPSKDAVHDIGVHCQVFNCHEVNNVMRVLAYPMNRCRLDTLITPSDLASAIAAAGVADNFPTSYLKDFGVSYALISNCNDEPYDMNSPEMKAILADAQLLLAEMSRVFPQNKSTVTDASKYLTAPEKLADMLGLITNALPEQIQEVLLELNVANRLRLVLRLLKAELEAGALQEKSLREMSASSEEAQSKALIKEYIKNLQKQAGLVDAKATKTHKFDQRLKHLKLTEEAMEAYLVEKEKLENPSEHLAEQSVSEKYLDWITSVPWGVYTKDRFDLKVARSSLDRDHYGLKDVKNRILEFISMGKISGKVDGKILCLVGPPGTGKTSIARSISEALNRSYARIAVGGIKDVHEIKGHKRTYIGSSPGRIISSLKQAKTSNPLLLIDEIDKIDVSAGGAPASALLEVLDPEQNSGFVDNYIDVKVDLSKVLFLCTANDLGGISAPLRDRMEVIEVPGYTNHEKLLIAEKHLIPQAAKKAGIDQKHVNISKETLEVLIEKYCKESGLRNIKKLITRVFSKASLFIVEMLDEAKIEPSAEKLVEKLEAELVEVKKQTEDKVEATATETTAGDTEARVMDENELQAEPLAIPDNIQLNIKPENLKDYVGPEVYAHSRVFEKLPPGVSTGLSYNYSGSGDILHIESILTNSISSCTGQAGIHATGHLGDMMKESSQIAYSFARLFMAKKYPENKFFEAAEIHINCPEGAIPKEGPSAGIAFVSSLISLATNQSLPATVAMTGEITLTGKVLPIGGLREKILGAKRNGCTKVIFPKDIEKSLEEIPDEVKEGVELIPVLWYDDVFDMIFADADKSKFGTVWADEFVARKNEKS